ncbi:MAG TPA: diaminopimelate epimerase [Acidobacteriaceae bacterium]|jgi:diaminopimelate epimerase|nr:diaminopimelate epimerase [Acidobacteriaceae bacterium]
MRFAKVHACSNDFLIVESPLRSASDQELAKKLCERHTGVGADGVEFLEITGPLAGTIRLANADGGIAEISGNGTRCVAAWIAHKANAAPGDVITLTTDAGTRICRVVEASGSHYQIAAGMGVPEVRQMQVILADKTIVYGTYVSMGNPHFVIVVNDENFRAHNRGWQELGKEICFHKDFPQQINVLFFRMIRADEIEIRIFERGVGPTTSSGTGTCASATALIAFCGGKSPVAVHAPGGSQRVDWAGPGTEMTLTGPAHLIAAGEVLLG